ncbi:MAG: hypothetical protein APR54_07705 [Candidatus Cloacimonas sp. SDB]|nr:MAG: hypothetical protein APR54_07705 [Candidatus Cloacimonas sp. SDB]
MKYIILVFLLISVFFLNAVMGEQTFTDRDRGEEYREFQDIIAAEIKPDYSFNSADSRLGISWQTSDPTAIANGVCVSSLTGNTFAEWILNSERAALYHDTAIPVWEHQIGDIDFDLPMDMLEDGSVIVIGDELLLKFFTPESSIPIWVNTLSFSIVDLALDPSGTGVYLIYYNSGNNQSHVEYYSLGVAEPVWSVLIPGNCQTLDISGDGSTLIFTQYGELDNMFVLDSADGSFIFTAPEYNQYPPAISYDASVIVNGDYGGYVYVYEYNNELETYEEAWNFSVGGDSWVVGMAISADGSTIAVGTLKFLPTSFDGEIYLFNRYSPTPLWIYENTGDEVIAIDICDDGSLIAAASYGPLNHSTADFFLFRRESNIPVFEINTSGSFFAVDISADGSSCAVAGKAVHAREMGNGGLLFKIDCDLGGGSITGVVDLENTADNGGVRVSIPELTDYFDYTDSEGNFLIENVPSDIYSVQYDKVGYIANSSTDVIVFEDEETDLGVITMFLTGAAPTNLYATQAADVSVTLNWIAPIEQEPVEYNIYRKRYAVDLYPEEPLATGGSGTFPVTFTDETALPQIQYYYVVTAVYASGLESPYSNEVTGWTSSGFITDEISAYTGTTPVIDGVISTGEWDDAFRLDNSDFWGVYDNTVNPVGSVIGYFKVNPQLTELYCAFINYNDTELEDHDEVALYIDDNNDGSFSPETAADEGNYWAAYYSTGNELRYRPIYDTGGVGSVYNLQDPQLEISVAAGYLVYEFMIPIGAEPWMINPSDDNMSGLAIFVLDDNTPDPHGFDSWWPVNNTDLFSPEGFGTIVYGADIPEPLAPENIFYYETEFAFVVVEWDQPEMNNFDHFNIYAAAPNDFELIAETVGTSYLYTPQGYSPELLYVTTVNNQGMESVPSDILEIITVDSNDDAIPLVTKLSKNYPNPFNPSTRIDFQLSRQDHVEIDVYNIKGQKVRSLVSAEFEAGVHTVIWSGRDDNFRSVSSGLYFYRMKSGNYTGTEKMILLK